MIIRAILRDRRAASAAEFGLILPLLILALFGVIDAGRYMWTLNRAEKAAQMGVRMAVVTNFVSDAVDANYVGQCSPAVEAGDPIPADCSTTITCSMAGATASCTSGTADSDAFNVVLARMKAFMPEITGEDVQIIYSPSGLGYAGNPNGPDIAPIVTVDVSGMTFEPLVLFSLASVPLRNVHSSLTFEDGIGSQSN